MIHIIGEEHDVEAWIAPEGGNRVASLAFSGHNVLHPPGIPFLAPWANRMPDGFSAGGRFYPLNKAFGNLQLDPVSGIPIHGLLMESPHWEVLHSTKSSVVSRLQFWRYPDLMTHWPFAHEYRMSFRLTGRLLEVRVTVNNLSAARMPVAIGFHPYFTIPGVLREQWTMRVPARFRVVHDERILPTGDLAPSGLQEFTSLRDYCFDSGYTGLEEHPRFRIQEPDAAEAACPSAGKAIEIRFGPTWPVAVVWSPRGEQFVCVEPMAAPTNGIDLHRRGLWPALQWIDPGAVWDAVFTIGAKGFCDTERS